MPRFQYQARDASGQVAAGTLTAPTLEEAGRLLRGDGKFIVRLGPAGPDTDQPRDEHTESVESAARKVRRADVIGMAQQMTVMLDTGVPISEALETIRDESANPAFRVLLADVTEHVRAGGEFSSALRKFPRVFPPIMVSLIRAGEMSGTIGRMLESAAAYLAKEQRITRQVRGALMYPAFMLAVAVGVTVFLLAFVLPRFAKIYAARNAVLPTPTRILLGASELLVHYWYLWIAAAVVLLIAAWLLARSATGRAGLDWIKIHAPLLGLLFRRMYLTRACRTFGAMIGAGVSVLDAVEIVRQATPNTHFERLWDQVDEGLRRGAQLSDPLMETRLLPRAVVQMIRSGEKSGRLAQVMAKVADFSEQEFDESVKTTTQFIEPVMIVLMGGMVGFVAVSLLLPIFNVSKVVTGNG